MRTAFGYVRVSSEEQAESGLGLEAQRQRVRAYCEMKGLDLAAVYEDQAQEVSPWEAGRRGDRLESVVKIRATRPSHTKKP